MISDWQTLHLRGDVDELEALHGLVDADHREGTEDLHHRRAFACDVGNMNMTMSEKDLENVFRMEEVKLTWMTFPFRRRKGGAWCAELLGGLRLERTHPCVRSA